MNVRLSHLAALAVTWSIFGAGAASAAVINVNQAFVNFENANSGPTAAVNGNFQYGTAPSTTSLTSGATAIPLFTQYSPAEHTDNLGGFNSNIQGYNQANSFLTPFTVVNTDTVNPQTICCGITLQPSEIGFHPDNGGSREYSIVLWTAPVNGTFTDSATYANRGGNATTAVYLQDPTGTQSSTSGAAPTLTGSGNILAGETIAFIVGLGSGGFGSNSTGLFATIDFVPAPEPSSIVALLGLGAMGLLFVVRRHRSVNQG